MDGLKSVEDVRNTETQPLTQPVPKPASTPRKNHRTAYMMAGSLATVVVLALAVVELPNLLHTQAKNGSHPVVQTSKPVAVSMPAPQQSTAPRLVETPGIQNTPKIVKQTNSPRVAAPEGKIVKDPQPKVEAPLAVPDVSAKSQQPVPQEPSPQQMEALRDRMGQMDARVSAVRSSLDNLQRQQAAAGLGLRTDMVAAQQHLLYLMSEAETNIRNQEAASAGKHLDAADAELNKLENFLGR